MNERMAEALRTLRAARKLIADPQRWTQGTEARNAGGSPTDVYSENAVRWCASGAIFRAAPNGDAGADALRQASEVAWRTYDLALPDVNDQFGHEAVLRVLDRAIAAAQRGTT
jgi:hypothetical protein